MTVAVDGVERYHWPVSTGIPSHETPNGSFRTFRMEEDHYSKEFDDAPMPHSIFFTKIGHAIHGTDSGRPARHAGVAWLRAAVARQRHDALCAGAEARRAQHHRDADRLVPGRAGRNPRGRNPTAVARARSRPKTVRHLRRAIVNLAPPRAARRRLTCRGGRTISIYGGRRQTVHQGTRSPGLARLAAHVITHRSHQQHGGRVRARTKSRLRPAGIGISHSPGHTIIHAVSIMNC